MSLNSTLSSLYGFPPSAAFAFSRLNDLKMLLTWTTKVITIGSWLHLLTLLNDVEVHWRAPLQLDKVNTWSGFKLQVRSTTGTFAAQKP